MALDPRFDGVFGSFVLSGPGWSVDVANRIVDATVSYGIDECSQISLTIDDPGWEIANSGWVFIPQIDEHGRVEGNFTEVAFADDVFVVDGFEINAGPGGVGGLTLTLLPRAVQRLRDPNFTWDTQNFTDTDFAKHVAGKAGISIKCDPDDASSGTMRMQSAENTEPDGSETTTNAWDELSHIAQANGWKLFQSQNKLILGKPSFCVNTALSAIPSYDYKWSENPDERVNNSIAGYPRISKSVAIDNDIDISITVPLEQALNVHVGGKLVLSGVPPQFCGEYIISAVSYSLTDNTGDVQVEATTIKDPKIDEANTVVDPGAKVTSDGSLTGTGMQGAIQNMITLVNDKSHGYDQAHRTGPDYDCSSSIYTALKAAGLPVPSNAWSTHTMVDQMLTRGWQVAAKNLQGGTGDLAKLQPGDVLVNPGKHTEMYIGNGNCAGFNINEKGGIRGGQPGDQTGRESRIKPYTSTKPPWRYVMRHTG